MADVREKSMNSPGFRTGWVYKLKTTAAPGLLHLFAWLSFTLGPFSP